MRRWLPVTVLAGAVAGLVAVGASAMEDGLVYYETPTEFVRTADRSDTVRLTGIVVPGSLDRQDGAGTLQLTDGVTDLAVAYEGNLPAILREGEGAVVEGRFDSGGTFRASEVVARHSNEYRRAP